MLFRPRSLLWVLTVIVVLSSGVYLTSSPLLASDMLAEVSAQLPFISTGGATNITDTGATLNGTVVINGSYGSLATSFDWGSDINCSARNIAGVPASLTAPATFTASLTGLTPGTTYYYRARVMADHFTELANTSAFVARGTWPAANTWLMAGAKDGQTLFALNTITGAGKLYQSVDGGVNWALNTTNTTAIDINGPFIALAVCNYADNKLVLIATAANIYGSTDGGRSFAPLSPIGSGSVPPAATAITSVDVVCTVSPPHTLAAIAIVVGTDAGAAIYDSREGFGGGWHNLGLPTGTNVYGVAFSPNYLSDGEILCVSQRNGALVVDSKVAAQDIDGTYFAGTSGNAPAIANTADAIDKVSFAFPSDYDAVNNNVFFVGVDSSGASADVYRVNLLPGGASGVLDLNVSGASASTAIYSLSFKGSAFSGQPVVQLLDSSGNIAANSNAAVTLTIMTGRGANGALLSGTVTVNAVNGIAVFSGLSIDLASLPTNSYYLTAASGYLTASSLPFQVVHPGDANGDGEVTMGDVTKVEREILALDCLTCGADANDDGKTTMADVTKIERIILTLDPLKG